MLLHWADFWHDCEHAARLATRPGPLLKYPLFVESHALPEIVRAFAALVAAGVVGLFPDWNITEVAPLDVTRSLHAVLKWLHHLEGKNVTLLHWAESWHDFEHAARLSRVPDPLFKYPLFDASHALSEIVRVFSAVVAAGVVG